MKPERRETMDYKQYPRHAAFFDRTRLITKTMNTGLWDQRPCYWYDRFGNREKAIMVHGDAMDYFYSKTKTVHERDIIGFSKAIEEDELEVILEPCPFCGAEADIRRPNENYPAYTVGCMTEGCIGHIGNLMRHSTDARKTADAWNKRAGRRENEHTKTTDTTTDAEEEG